MSAPIILSPRRFGRLLAADAMNVARDPIMPLAIIMCLVPAIALRLFGGSMDSAAEAAFGLPDLSRYVAAIALVIPAGLLGWVAGFLLLEDRDEGTLLAIDVTPVGKQGFLAYRVSATALAAVALTLYNCWLAIPGLTIPTMLLLCVVVACNAVAAAVILPAFARNKVEGLALTKLTNLVILLPLIAAIPSPLRFFGGILPSYWVGELLGLPATPLPLAVAAPLAIAVNVAAVALLFGWFGRRAG